MVEPGRVRWRRRRTFALPHNRLGFAYQVAFVRLFDRFPQQQPFELFEELVCFSAAQLGLDPGLIELYRKRSARPRVADPDRDQTTHVRARRSRLPRRTPPWRIA